jgi:HTH-type transcriptional regulator/antitoxin HigA
VTPKSPLTKIQNDHDLGAAELVIDQLLETGQQEYLDVLTDLVERYQDKHEPLMDVSDADVLRELMRANGLTQTGLSKKVKIAQSTLSSVLTGDRSLTKEQIVALASFFHVAPAVFLPVPGHKPA